MGAHQPDLPRLNIGRASDQAADRVERERIAGADVCNVAVRRTDRSAFLGIIAAREEQIERFGHSAEADLDAPAIHLPKLAARYAQDAVEDLQFGDKREQSIKKLERAAALILAAIPRLKAEQ